MILNISLPLFNVEIIKSLKKKIPGDVENAEK